MKVVLDTNVLVSGIFFRGIPGRIVDAWIDDKIALFCTPSIMEEYARVIHELSIYQDNLLSIEWIDNLIELCHMIPDPPKTGSYSRDRHDDKFIFCAISAKADYLVTGDKDLTSLYYQFPFLILSPNQFLSRLTKIK